MDMVQALKSELGLEGPLASVLEQACEQLGVRDSGGTLLERARVCVASLGCDVPRASDGDRSALVGARQVLCDFCAFPPRPMRRRPRRRDVRRRRLRLHGGILADAGRRRRLPRM